MNTVTLNISQNPWSPNNKEFSFDNQLFEKLVNELIAECSGRTYNSAYAYDKHVEKFINSLEYSSILYSDDILNENKKYYTNKIIEKLLSSKMNLNDWHDGAYSAYRSLQTMNLYSNPYFYEAVKNSNS